MKIFQFIIAIFLSLIITNVYAGYVKGKITDENGAPLPFASIYINNTSYGVASDLNGNYFLELKKGTYTITYSFVGYVTEYRNVTIDKSSVTLDIQLTSMSLNEVEIVADTKDRAKSIMKKVRDNRKFYLDQIDSYSCKTYLKTSLEKETHETLPDSLQSDVLAKTKDLKSLLKKENLNLIESVSTSYYQRPGKHKEVIEAYHDYADVNNDQRNVSFSVSYGESDIAPTQYFSENPYLVYNDAQSSELNFYKNFIEFDAVCQKPLLSPIAATSLLSYKYNYIGSFYENEKLIYKIDVEPLFKSEALFHGTIYIEDSSWALKTVDLQINKSVLLFCEEFQIIQNYEEISPTLFVPYRRELIYTIKEGKNHIIGNTRVNHSNYNVNLELPAKTFGNEVKHYTDDAFDKDSSFWNIERPITLKESELEYIHKTDSLKEYFTSDAYYRKIDSSFNKINIWSLLNGVGHRSRKLGTEFYFSGLFEQMNFVGIGGYRHKLPGYFNKDFTNGMKLETKGFVDYGFRNKDVKGELGMGLTYFPKKFVRTFISAGDYYDQVNNYASLSQAFSRSNYVRTKTFSIAQRMEIFNGFFAELSFLYSDQSPINDLELSSWSGQLFGNLNTPIEFDRYTKSELKLELKYRLNQKYVIKKGKKIIIGSDYPELHAIYRKGVPDLLKSEVDFDYWEIGARDEMQLARWGSSDWEVKAGGYFNKTNLRILEYKYFRGSDRFYFSNPITSFQLLGPTLSTPNEYFKANFIHHFEGSLLNKVPVINKLKLALATGGGTIVIPEDKFEHVEFFLGMERIFRIRKQLFRIGVYAVTADSNIDKADYTMKFGISFYNTYTKKWEM